MTWRAMMAFFLLSWLSYGALVNSKDLNAYTLQHAGVEAVVERGTYALGNSRTPRLNNPGDSFSFQGRTFAAKQPGQFTIGAFPYSLLRACGFSYETHYEVAAAFVSWWTAGLFLALTSTILLHLATSLWGFSHGAGLLIATSVGFGQTGFAYISVPHHDVLATCFLVMALWAIELGKQAEERWSPAFIAGLALGFAVWTSMLAGPPGATLGLYALIRLPSRAWLLLGGLLGILPLLAYNLIYFGHPLTPPNIVGGFRDTFFEWNVERFFSRFWLYLGLGDLGLIFYSPIAFTGMLGVFFTKPALRERTLLPLGLLATHLFYICNIETVGHCQYGPRYLIPLLPFLILGVLPMWSFSFGARVILILISIISLFINLIGALGGTMYCSLNEWAVTSYLRDFLFLEGAHFPLTELLL